MEEDSDLANMTLADTVELSGLPNSNLLKIN
jgi:hypothetical protein